MGLPAIIIRLSGTELSAAMAVAIFGLGILVAAMLLGGASEAAQHDIPPSLSLAILAFVAVLLSVCFHLMTKACSNVSSVIGGIRSRKEQELITPQ